MTKAETTSPQSGSNGLAVASLVLGIVSFAGPGLLTGIPAVVLGIIALRKSATDRGLSWAGIITGGIASLLSLLVILFFVVLTVFVMMSAPAPDDNQPDTSPWSHDTTYQSSEL